MTLTFLHPIYPAPLRYASPFAYGAYKAGFRLMGGKMDDITVVISIVEQPKTTSAGAVASSGDDGLRSKL